MRSVLKFLLQSVFFRRWGQSRIWRNPRGLRRWAATAGSVGRQAAGAVSGLVGFDALEARAMLAVDDIFVSLSGSRVVLRLDDLGATIQNLNTSYDATLNVLTITAAGANDITTSTPGITVNSKLDTIAVSLGAIKSFAGITVVGGPGRDSVTVGPNGVNLGAVTKGAASQGFSIDTGAGTDDLIKVDSPIVAKAAGAVSLTTLGSSAGNGIQLGSSVRTPSGPQTYAGVVTLTAATSLTAGGPITFTKTVDGANRLAISSGGAVSFSGAVGSTTPLQGITLSQARSTSFGGPLSLDGTGAALGSSGLVIGKGVNNVLLSGTKNSITGFTTGSGVQFLGGSTGSRIVGTTISGNRTGITVGPGVYTSTVIAGNTISNNTGDGIVLNGSRSLVIGGGTVGAGNLIVANGGYGIASAGSCSFSYVSVNEISGNALGAIKDFLNSSLRSGGIILCPTGLLVALDRWAARRT